jgi:hypothetical protein
MEPGRLLSPRLTGEEERKTSKGQWQQHHDEHNVRKELRNDNRDENAGDRNGR